MAIKALGKINGRLAFLYRKQSFLNYSLRRLLCNALIQPHFDYACSVWYPTLNSRLSKKIQTAQNKCIRFCLGMKNTTHLSAKEFLKINWLPTKKRVEQTFCGNVYKFFEGNFPVYFCEMFRHTTEIRITRRSKYSLVVPFRKSSIGQKCSSYMCPKLWNDLPPEIKTASSINSFKHKIKSCYMQNLSKNKNMFV